MKRSLSLLPLVLLLTAAPVAAEEAAPAAPKPLPGWVDALTPMADLRYRHELIDEEGGTMRNRHRIRARLGVDARLLPCLSMTFQLASGTGDPVSTNQTLTGAFSGKPVWIDLAFFDYHPGWLEGLKLAGGKVKNPFATPGKTELVWDHDMNPEGVFLGYSQAFGSVEPFVTTGMFWVEERSKAKDAWLLGAQAGLKVTLLSGNLYLLAGGGYYDYTQTKGMKVYYDGASSFGNSADSTDPDALTYLFDYNLVEGMIEIGWKILGFPVAVVGDFIYNLDPSDDNIGFLAGLVAGKTKDPLSFQVRYNYRQVERDAVLGLFTDSDFRGGGSDGAGHEVGIDFVPARHLQLGATYLFNTKGVDNGTDFHRFQLDLAVKL